MATISSSRAGARQQRAADLAAHMPLVKKIARTIGQHLPASVDRNDLMQAGLIGLNDALSRFESGQGSTFESYAARRIRGAMLDELRANDPLPRHARSRVRDVANAVRRLEHRLGRAPRATEVANELGWPLKKFHDCMVEAGAGGTRSGDEVLENMPDPFSDPAAADAGYTATQVHADPLRALEQRRRHAALSAAFDILEEADRYVMESIYDRDMKLRDIGKTLGISESRVSQICTTIIAKLRLRLSESDSRGDGRG